MKPSTAISGTVNPVYLRSGHLCFVWFIIHADVTNTVVNSLRFFTFPFRYTFTANLHSCRMSGLQTAHTVHFLRLQPPCLIHNKQAKNTYLFVDYKLFRGIAIYRKICPRNSGHSHCNLLIGLLNFGTVYLTMLSCLIQLTRLNLGLINFGNIKMLFMILKPKFMELEVGVVIRY